MNGLNIYMPRGTPPEVAKGGVVGQQQNNGMPIRTGDVIADSAAGPLAAPIPPSPNATNYSRPHGNLSTSQPPLSRTNPKASTSTTTTNGIQRSISSEFGPTTRSSSSNNLRLAYNHAGGLHNNTTAAMPFFPPSSSSSPSLFAGEEDSNTTNENSTTREGNYGSDGLAQEGGQTSAPVTASPSTASAALLNTTDNTPPSPSSATPTPGASSSQQWSSAVGRANLGKSGRVIERLMGENDMLKRDVQIERLRAEESKNSVKMAEGKMEAVVSEYEGKLHDAAVHRTLLKRRERQVQDLKGQVEGEKKRVEKAEEREKGWREEVERVRVEWGEKVERATEREKAVEGRNKVLEGYWGEQRRLLDEEVERMKGEITVVVKEREEDDKRMKALEALCAQQKEMLERLEKEKEGIEMAFERYKDTESEALRGIKEEARKREEEDDRRVEEATRVLGELKWALGVNENVRGAR